ncbi:phosphoadenosine phosphosulfate reductase family protein [Bacillus cereus group sp. TH36-2LC]|uniref:phosphoadenosine phosphosulfate reductase family protein n=1 Tax=Bacillus cereus group sp. TH36-2LC TaxID=3018040 RepID=UPI0022E61DF1|nr:phosphoadenosine phosphosulfate reductase family protein [Bacillus cereus group sp. TH36-2LC]MDA1509619.1 phosphoadenosine phosphosulfate reductase family protein [Bacillus cereus group sp. TH36-2LC]
MDLKKVIENYGEQIRPYRDATGWKCTRADKETRYFFYELNKKERQSVEVKERHAIDLLKMALKDKKNPVVSCSFGVDSIVTLYLCRKAMVELGRNPSDLVVFWSDTLNEFPEVRLFAKNLEKEWNLDLRIAKPKKVLKKIIEENGGVDSSYFTARKGARGEGRPLSEKCCDTLKHKPYKTFLKSGGFDLQINGIRADESNQRFLSSLRDSEYYYASREWKILIARPILWWDDLDIWGYVEKENIPFNDLYKKNMIKKYPDDIETFVSENKVELVNMGIDTELLVTQQLSTVTRLQAVKLKEMGFKDIYTARTGCMMCPIPIKYGYLKWMRTYYPKVYNAMLTNLGYAKGLMGLLTKEQKEELEFLLGIEITIDNIDEVLKDVLVAKPCVFDFDDYKEPKKKRKKKAKKDKE